MKKLSLKQIVKVGAHLFMETKQFERANILVKDNSKEEILDITNEIHLFNGQNYYSEKDLDLQKNLNQFSQKKQDGITVKCTAI